MSEEKTEKPVRLLKANNVQRNKLLKIAEAKIEDVQREYRIEKANALFKHTAAIEEELGIVPIVKEMEALDKDLEALEKQESAIRKKRNKLEKQLQEIGVKENWNYSRENYCSADNMPNQRWDFFRCTPAFEAMQKRMAPYQDRNLISDTLWQTVTAAIWSVGTVDEINEIIDGINI